MENKEEILKALQVIQNVCKSKTCDDCPFGQADLSCGIREEMPQNWRIKSNDIWRAFED